MTAQKWSAKWEQADAAAKSIAAERARRVAEVVAYAGGKQSAAAHLLGLDQSTVSKLVKKAKTA